MREKCFGCGSPRGRRERWQLCPLPLLKPDGLRFTSHRPSLRTNCWIRYWSIIKYKHITHHCRYPSLAILYNKTRHVNFSVRRKYLNAKNLNSSNISFWENDNMNRSVINWLVIPRNHNTVIYIFLYLTTDTVLCSLSVSYYPSGSTMGYQHSHL